VLRVSGAAVLRMTALEEAGRPGAMEASSAPPTRLSGARMVGLSVWSRSMWSLGGHNQSEMGFVELSADEARVIAALPESASRRVPWQHFIAQRVFW
jgi:hypothetical protein